MSDFRSGLFCCLVIFVLLLVGCGEDDEVIQLNDGEESCEDVCVVGQSRCVSDGVEYCVDVADCPSWSGAIACPGDEACVDGRCEGQCDDQCIVGERTCSDDDYQVCQYDAQGCAVWSDPASCQGDGEVCSGGECTETCTDQCSEGESQCLGTEGVQVCAEQSSGCLDWSQSQQCGDGLICESGECVAACTNECGPDDAQCDGNGDVQLCQEMSDGCYGWSVPFECPGDFACEAGQCVDSCPADCSTDVDGATAYCSGADCVVECAFSNHTLCEDYDICVDTQTDDEHCGGCGQYCSSGQSCQEGGCVDLCTGGLDYCAQAGGCVDLNSNNDYCGSCSNQCAGGESCVSGQCQPQALDGCDPAASPFGGGEGNAVAPYRICSAVQLIRIDDSEENLGLHYVLYDNIDLTGLGFSVIGQGQGSQGDWTGAFSGDFNGNGFFIHGLTLDSPNSDRIALFGVLDDGVIRNLGLTDVDITGRDAVGAVVAHNEGTVLNVHGTGAVSGREKVGGLAGHNSPDGAVEESSFGGLVEGSSRSIGGLVGFSNGKIIDSESSADVHGVYFVGGLVGEGTSNVNCLIERSRATGDIHHIDDSGQSNYAFGGLVGGFDGYGDCEINESMARGDLEVSAFRVGGFIGQVYRTELIIRNSYATGNIDAGSRRGGFVGIVNSMISSPSPAIINSYSFGSVNGGTTAFLGIDFEGTLTISNSYWNSDVNDSDNSTQTTGLSQAGFDQQSNFSGWDFGSIWEMSTDAGRPVLQWELE